MVQQNILTDSLTNADVAQPNWIYGVSQPGAANPFLTARSSSAPSGPGGLPGGGSDAAGSGALQLTNNSGSQGSFVIYNKPINSSAGLSIQFDLYAYGGTTPGADGTSFFLIDGNQSPTTGGAVGGSLGYSSSPTGAAGIVGGYLGIGFDEFGNFSSPDYGSGGPGQTAQSIAVRGSQATGYKYLTGSKLPNGETIDTPGATSRSGAVRSVEINLDSQSNLSVYFDPTGKHNFDTNDEVITNYNVKTLNGDLPSTFKFGFAASTGGSTNYHAVNNLTFNTFGGAYTPLVSFPAVNTTVTPANPLTVTASLDVAATQDVTIPLNFGGTATKGTDYSPSADSITIKANQTTGSIVLTDNSSAASGKTVQISLGTPTNATLSPQASTLTATLANPAITGPTLVLGNSAVGEAAAWGLNGSQLAAAGFFQGCLPSITLAHLVHQFSPSFCYKIELQIDGIGSHKSERYRSRPTKTTTKNAVLLDWTKAGLNLSSTATKKQHKSSN